MLDLELMSKAVDFIEDNLQKTITVADMADAVSYSLYYFCRTFNQATHHTPYDYLMRRRLSESARALLQTDRKIIEIAFDYQFSAPETFSRAFKRMFDIQPNQLRKQGRIDRRCLMPRLSLAYLRHIGKGTYLKPVLDEKSALNVAGVMTLVKDDPTAISDIWELLGQELESDRNATGPRNYYGVAYYPENWEEHGLLYMAAVEIQNLEAANVALAIKMIPALQYVRFIHKGPTRDLSLTLEYVYHTWLPQSGMSLLPSFVIEHYGQDFRAADDQEFERRIYIPVQSQ